MFQTVSSEEGAHTALAPILHSANFLSTCSRPAGKDSTQPQVWILSSQLPKPRLLQHFPQNPSLPPTMSELGLSTKQGSEVKGRGMVGCHTMPYSWPAGPLWIQESLPAVCPVPLAWGYRNEHFSLASSPLLKTIMAEVRGSYWVLWECPGGRH